MGPVRLFDCCNQQHFKMRLTGLILVFLLVALTVDAFPNKRKPWKPKAIREKEARVARAKMEPEKPEEVTKAAEEQENAKSVTKSVSGSEEKLKSKVQSETELKTEVVELEVTTEAQDIQVTTEAQDKPEVSAKPTEKKVVSTKTDDKPEIPTKVATEAKKMSEVTTEAALDNNDICEDDE